MPDAVRGRPFPTVDSVRDDPLYPRVERAVAAILATGQVVAPVDVLVRMELLEPARLEDWRRGRVPYLERVIRFGLLQHIEEGHDDVIFFADEGGSWQVGAEWRTALPACFQCLAESATPEEFAREVDRAIKAFAEYDRRRHLTAARRVASVEQKAALRALLAR